ncbi:hypothetical protein EVA_20943, partial [gut metagenome]
MLHIQCYQSAETLHVCPSGYLSGYIAVVGKGFPGIVPEYQFRTFAYPVVIEVGYDKELGFHLFAYG